MSWVAVGTTAAGALLSSGGGGGGSGGGAPAGPMSLDSGRVSFGDFNLTPKGSVSAPAWLVPVLVGVAVVGGLIVTALLFARRSRA